MGTNKTSKYRKRQVQTADKTNIEIAEYGADNPRGRVFVCHGLSVPKEGPANILAEAAQALAEAGFEVVSFNFRGNGDSGGYDYDMTIGTGLVDLEAVFRAYKDDLPVGFLGFSYGAAVAVEYITRHQVKPTAVVLYSPVLDFRRSVIEHPNSVLGELYKAAAADGSLERDGYFTVPHNGFRVGKNVFDEASDYQIASDFAKITAPKLIIQGRNDQMLWFAVQKELGKPAADEFLVLDAVHGLTEQKEQAIQKTADWFKRFDGSARR
jgi:pimeloyl-ACP methyl ester carboxylesterase